MNTRITYFDYPERAEAGEEVTVLVTVQNLSWFSWIHAAAGGIYNGSPMSFSPSYHWLGPRGIYTFTGTFTMPNKSVDIHVASFYWTGDAWVQEDLKSGYITLGPELVEEFKDLEITSYGRA